MFLWDDRLKRKTGLSYMNCISISTKISVLVELLFIGTALIESYADILRLANTRWLSSSKCYSKVVCQIKLPLNPDSATSWGRSPGSWMKYLTSKPQFFLLKWEGISTYNVRSTMQIRYSICESILDKHVEMPAEVLAFLPPSLCSALPSHQGSPCAKFLGTVPLLLYTDCYNDFCNLHIIYTHPFPYYPLPHNHICLSKITHVIPCRIKSALFIVLS